MFWNPQDLLLMMATQIFLMFKIDASWAEKLTKTRVSFLTAQTVDTCIKYTVPTEYWVRLAKELFWRKQDHANESGMFQIVPGMTPSTGPASPPQGAHKLPNSGFWRNRLDGSEEKIAYILLWMFRRQGGFYLHKFWDLTLDIDTKQNIEIHLF